MFRAVDGEVQAYGIIVTLAIGGQTDGHNHGNDYSAHISIDGQGVISSDPVLPWGLYAIEVRALSESGTSIFKNAFRIRVNTDPGSVTYDDDVGPLLISRCGPCHVGGTAAEVDGLSQYAQPPESDPRPSPARFARSRGHAAHRCFAFGF